MRYRFGTFALDEESRQLSRRGVELPIPSRAIDLLSTLLLRRSEIVTRGELLRILWPNTSPTEASLEQLVAALRRALGDDEENPLWIHSAGKRGYVFVGDAREGEAIASTGAARSHWVIRWNGREIDLLEGENLIGRDPEAVVRFASAGASRRHARIVISGRSATIEDLGSKNGTFVWRTRVEGERLLRSGDRLRIGDEVFYFERSKRKTAVRRRPVPRE